MSSFDPDYSRVQFKHSDLNLIQQKFEEISPNNQESNAQNPESQTRNIHSNLETSENNNQILNDLNKREEQKETPKIEEQPLFIPKFLEKFSNTFFRKTDPSMNPNEYIKQKQEKKEKKKKQKEQINTHKEKNENNKQSNQQKQDPQQESDQKQSERRAASSIAFDIPSLSQSRFSGFIQSIKNGATSLMRSMRSGVTISSESQQLPCTESDEINIMSPVNSNLKSQIEKLNINKNTGMIEFPTEESESPLPNPVPNKQNSKKLKEQHVSIIDQAEINNPNANKYLDPDSPQIQIEIGMPLSAHKRFLSAQPNKNIFALTPNNKQNNQCASVEQQMTNQNQNKNSTESSKLPPKKEIEHAKNNQNVSTLREDQAEENSVLSEQTKQPGQDQSSILSTSRMDKSTSTCLVCFDKSPDSVFMDCGHGGVCYDCALEIWKKTGECYLCRLKIVQVLQVDLQSKIYGLIKVISSTQMVQKDVDESQQSSVHLPPQQLEEIAEDNQE